MNINTILRLLKNSGFNIIGTDDTFLYLEDPSCILRSFQTFLEYAWIVIACITGLLLFGWAISMIRGAKNDIFTNLRTLTLIFGILSAAGPIVNTIWGGDLFAKGCRTIKVPIAEVNEMLEARKKELGENDKFYEEIDIYDSGINYEIANLQPHEIPYSQAPLIAPGTPDTDANISVSSDNNTIRTQTNRAQVTNTSNRGNQTKRPSRAQASSKDVIYTNPDGSRYRRTGGTRAWRNMNPGNIRYSEFSRRMGAIGEAGGFAVFPDEETGMRAISALLQTDSYINLTVAGAISRYAPPSENNTAAYHRQIQDLTGLSINKRMSDLTDAELSRVATAIRKIEGWVPGKTINE